MNRYSSALAVAGLVALASCVGGGSDSSDRQMSPDPIPESSPDHVGGGTNGGDSELMEPTRTVMSADLAGHEPVRLDVKGIPVLIGTADIIWEDDDPDNGWENDLTDDDYSQTHGSARVGYASAASGIAVAELIRFLKAETPSSGSVSEFVQRWSDPPTVRMAADATRQDRREILIAVQMINSALPPDWQLTVLDTGADSARGLGYIDVFFMPITDWPLGNSGDVLPATTLGVERGRGSVSTGQYAGSEIYINSTHPQHTTSERRINTLLHEIMHGLGRYHVSPEDFESTVLHAEVSFPTLDWFFLAPIDTAILLAIYRDLSVGQRLENETDDASDTTGLDAGDFGDWNTDSFHVFGELPHTGSENMLFGAIWKHGQVRPYVIGQDPAPEMTETEGSASWSGRLLGLTPDVRTVGGDMDMVIRFGATVEGELDFTEMREWDAKSGPGTTDTGTQWTGGNTDGELHYGIEVRGGLLFSESDDAGNDDGRITGQFFGTSHEGAAGTLRRSDLSAGFAGTQLSE